MLTFPTLTLKNSLALSFLGVLLLPRILSVSVAEASGISFPLFLGLWAIYRCFIFPFLLSPLRRIPTIPGIPVFGNIFTIAFSEFGAPQREWHREHGPIIRYIYCFGSERISVIDDEAIKHITVRDPYNFIKPEPIRNWMGSVLGRGVLLVEGEEHMRQRKALSSAFSTASIRNLTPVFWEKGLLLSRLLMDQVQLEATPIEVLDWLNRATLDVIGAAAFGYDINSLQSPSSPLRNAYSSVFSFDLTTQVIQTMNNLCSWSRYIPSKANRDMNSAIRTIKETAADIVRAKQEEDGCASGGKDIMALVTRENNSAKNESDDTILDFETMRDQIMTFLGAGHDTTATGVMWTLDLLTKHSDVQDRLRKEIRGAFPDLRVEPASSGVNNSSFLQSLRHGAMDVDQLPYLSKVCRESLRCIPPIPLTIRENLQATELCGYDIPAGTWIYVIANVINRAPTFWGNNADCFDPDRWDDLPETYTTNAFMTFLYGPRSCIGRKFAETEMKVFLCCLLANFRFERDLDWPDQELYKKWRLVLKPRDGLHLKLNKVEG